MRRLPPPPAPLAVLVLLGLLSSLLSATLVAERAGAAPATAPGSAPASGKPSTVTLRLSVDRVTVFSNGTQEPTGLVAQVAPAVGGREVAFSQLRDGAWVRLGTARTDATGRAYRPVPVDVAGTTTYRVGVAANARFRAATSSPRRLLATPNTQCGGGRQPVDGGATGEVHCLLARLDAWGRSGVMGVGQQVNISRFPDWDAPLQGIAPAVVGFDLEELGQAATAEHPYADANIRGLLARAKAGAVLTASWHARNPFTGQSSSSPRRSLGALLRPSTAEERQAATRFWDDYDAKLELLRRFQDGDADGDGDDGADDGERTAVIFRPFHEVNGGFFWWGKPDPDDYRALWQRLQDRAGQVGVRNLVWAYAGNRDTSSTDDPAVYMPVNLDVGGLDTYDPELGAANAPDRLPLEGYRAIRDALPYGLSRMALTETGPHGSRDGSWNPAVITRTVRSAKITPLWAMLWFDDGRPTTANPAPGLKQITSLAGGRSWLAGCFTGLCHLR